MAEHFSYWALRNLTLPLQEKNPHCTPFKPCSSCFFWAETIEHPEGGCTHPDPNSDLTTCYTPMIEGDS